MTGRRRTVANSCVGANVASTSKRPSVNRNRTLLTGTIPRQWKQCVDATVHVLPDQAFFGKKATAPFENGVLAATPLSKFTAGAVRFDWAHLELCRGAQSNRHPYRARERSKLLWPPDCQRTAMNPRSVLPHRHGIPHTCPIAASHLPSSCR